MPQQFGNIKESSKNNSKKNIKSKEPLKSKLTFGVLDALKNILLFVVPKKVKINYKEPFYKTISELKASSKKMSQEEKNLLNNFLKFGSKTVASVMIPRSEISAVEINISQKELNELVILTRHTRTLVYEDTLDNILGFVHIKDLFITLAENNNFNLKKLIRHPIISAPSMKLVDLLDEMQKERTHIAIVLDEYGGTDGIVTIEDIMEEIVGTIEDEHDKFHEDHYNYKLINPKTLISSARVDIEELENVLGVKLRKPDDDDVETIGGLILARAGQFPNIGARIKITDNITAEVIEAEPRNLKSVKLIVDGSYKLNN